MSAGADPRWICTRCMISFRIGEQPHRTTERTSCAVCKLNHWMLTNMKRYCVIVGIEAPGEP